MGVKLFKLISRMYAKLMTCLRICNNYGPWHCGSCTIFRYPVPKIGNGYIGYYRQLIMQGYKKLKTFIMYQERNQNQMLSKGQENEVHSYLKRAKTQCNTSSYSRCGFGISSPIQNLYQIYPKANINIT